MFSSNEQVYQRKRCRVLKLTHRTTPKHKTVRGFNPPSEAGGKRPARERDFQVCTKPTTRIVCSFKLPSAAGGKRPARERDFQVCAKLTTRTESSFKLVSLLDFDFCPLSLAETGPVENTSHALVNKQRNPCTNQSPANRITKYPC